MGHPQSLFPGTTGTFTRFDPTAQRDSEPALPCHHCQLTWLLCASVSPPVKNPLRKAPSELLDFWGYENYGQTGHPGSTPCARQSGRGCPCPPHSLTPPIGAAAPSTVIVPVPSHPLPGRAVPQPPTNARARERSRLSPTTQHVTGLQPVLPADTPVPHRATCLWAPRQPRGSHW